MGGDVRGPRMEVHVEGIGPITLHMHQGASDHPGDEGGVVEAADPGQMEGPGARGAGGLGGGDHAGEAQPPPHVLEPQPAVVEHEALDQGQAGGLAAAGPEGPVVAAGLVGIEGQVRVFDIDQRQLHPPGQQRQQPHLHRGLAEVGHLALATAEPWRIADPDAADPGPGLPGEWMHLQMALDLDLPAGAQRQVAGHRAAEPIPVEQGEEHRYGQGEQQPGAGGADQTPAPAPVGEGVAHAGAGARVQPPQAFAESESRLPNRTGRGWIGHALSAQRRSRRKALCPRIVPDPRERA